MSLDTALRSLAIALLAAIFSGSLLGASQDGPPPAPVRVSAVIHKEMSSLVRVPGTVISRSDARLSAEVAGQLTWVADVGDVIRKGSSVARINDEALQLQLMNDDVTIKRLEANLEFIQQQVARVQKLTEQQIVAANELEERTSQFKSAEQELIAARVAREGTLYRLAKCEVTAPFSGRVAERLQQPGGYASIGGPIVRLVDLDNVEVRAQAPLSVAPFLREGMHVTVQDQGRKETGRIRTMISVGDDRSRMFEIRLSLEGTEPWMVGSAVRIELPSSTPREVMAVPRDALVLRADSIYVVRISGNSTAERLQVQTGIGSGSHIEIEGALEAGDQVVVRGAERLRSGQAVTVSDGLATQPTPSG